MISELELKEVIVQVLKNMDLNKEPVKKSKESELADTELKDIGAVDLRKVIDLEAPYDRETLLKYKSKTPARLGISRAGSRYKTNTYLRLRADHASAQDAVFTEVSDEFLERVGLERAESKCLTKDEFITRPDLGRELSDESVKKIKNICKFKPKVQVFIADGLSSTAIETNAEDTMLSLLNGLKTYGLETGTPFFVKNSRVGLSDHVAEILEPEITCVLIGERPGLATAESMSAYITYKGYRGIEESKRTVISNIHKHGTTAAEAGAHIASIIKKISEAKASGQDLKL